MFSGMGGLNVLAPPPDKSDGGQRRGRGRGRGRGRPSKQPKSSKLFIEDDATAESEVDPDQKLALEDGFLVSKVWGHFCFCFFLRFVIAATNGFVF